MSLCATKAINEFCDQQLSMISRAKSDCSWLEVRTRRTRATSFDFRNDMKACGEHQPSTKKTSKSLRSTVTQWLHHVILCLKCNIKLIHFEIFNLNRMYTAVHYVEHAV